MFSKYLMAIAVVTFTSTCYADNPVPAVFTGGVNVPQPNQATTVAAQAVIRSSADGTPPAKKSAHKLAPSSPVTMVIAPSGFGKPRGPRQIVASSTDQVAPSSSSFADNALSSEEREQIRNLGIENVILELKTKNKELRDKLGLDNHLGQNAHVHNTPQFTLKSIEGFDGHWLATITYLSGQEISSVKVGDNLPGIGKVTSIDSDKMVVLIHGKKTIIHKSFGEINTTVSTSTVHNSTQTP